MSAPLATPRGLPGVLAAALAVGLIALARPPLARAGSEEWSTFEVESQEEDDESILDHMLTATPRQWREAWERAPQAFRTEQGCLTSGQWFIQSDLKLHAPLGRHAEFGLLMRQTEDDAQSFDYVDLQFRFPTAWGAPGAWFRPFFDKSRQDFSLTWELGADTTAEQVQLAFTLEDAFNNLWAFRQTRVGGLLEPYQRRPYEPAVRWVSRHERLRVELGGRWLTPSRKRVNFGGSIPSRTITLWGTHAQGTVEVKALGLEWSALTENMQAFSTDSADGFAGNGAHFRRRWFVEAGALRRLSPRLTAETRWRYTDRDAWFAPPVGPNSFRGLDRVVTGEARWEFRPGWTGKAGAMYDRIGIAAPGPNHAFTWGTRKESRAYVGLEATFGNVVVAGVEGIELDHETYEVWFVHDKGFLQLQARF